MDWWHTANLLAQTANLHRPKHAPSVQPARLNPFAKTKTAARQATPEEIQQLLGPNWHEVKTS
jgi:hypothetical protein